MATISIVDGDSTFRDALEEYIEIKSMQKQLSYRLDELLAIFEEYAGIDKESSFEGKQLLSCGNATVTLEYKINRNVNKDALRELCKKVKKQPTAFVNIKYEYPGKKFIEAMIPSDREEMEKCFKQTRGKTSVSIDIKGE